MLTKLECAEYVLEHDVAGSCLSMCEVNSLTSEKIKLETGEDSTYDATCELIDAAMDSTELFLCTDCNWWCWAHEMSFNDSHVCADCAGDEEDE